MSRIGDACQLHSCQKGFSPSLLSVLSAQPTERTLPFSLTNFHLPAGLRTQRTLGGSGTPPEIPGHLPRVRSASAGAAGSSALRRRPPLRSWPLVGLRRKKERRSWRPSCKLATPENSRRAGRSLISIFRHQSSFRSLNGSLSSRCSSSITCRGVQYMYRPGKAKAREAEPRPAAAASAPISIYLSTNE